MPFFFGSRPMVIFSFLPLAPAESGDDPLGEHPTSSTAKSKNDTEAVLQIFIAESDRCMILNSLT
jgi:hypothetical protein